MQCLKFTSHATPLMKLFEEIPHQNERIYQEKGRLDVRTQIIQPREEVKELPG